MERAHEEYRTDPEHDPPNRRDPRPRPHTDPAPEPRPACRDEDTTDDARGERDIRPADAYRAELPEHQAERDSHPQEPGYCREERQRRERPACRAAWLRQQRGDGLRMRLRPTMDEE